MSKYKIINQFEEYDCAPAAVAMLIYQSENRKYSLSELKMLLNTSSEGTSFKDIYLVLKNFDYNPSLIECVKDIEVFSEIKTPIITQIKKRDTLHFITIFEIKKKYIVYGDPLKKDIQKISKKKFLKIWVPYIISVNKINLDNNRKNGAETIIDTFQLMKNNIRFIILPSIISLIAYVLTIILAGMYAIYFDTIIPSEAEYLIINFMGVYLSLALLQLILEIVKSKFLIKYSNSLDSTLINMLVNNFFDIKFDIVSKLDPGELVTRFSQISTIRERIISITQRIPINIVIIISTFVILFTRSYYLSLLIFIPMILYFLLYIFSKEKYEQLSFNLYQKTEGFNTKFIESLDNITTIKSYNMSKNTALSLNNKLRDLLDVSEQFNYYDAILTTVRNTLLTIFSVLLFSIGAYLIIQDNIAQGSFLMFNALTFQVLNPFIEIVNLQSSLQQGLVSEDKLEDILLASKEDITLNEETDSNLQKILAKNLSYSYNNQEEILTDINFAIKENEKIAIIGGNGSGKSTFGKILSGLTLDFEGDILINGISYDSLSERYKREKVSYITEHVEIFNDTVLENILLHDDSNQDRMDEVFQNMNMNKLFDKLPEKEKTIIGEHGKNLSKGQLQMLNICRAFNKNSFLHIYDEATSGLDIQNKQTVEDFLLNNKIAKIFITHDLSFANKCDKIYILENGILTEIDKHTLNI